MPSSSEDRQRALDIMEWAYGTQAEPWEAAPELVTAYRKFCERPFVDEATWREAFDLALGIWKKAYDERLRRQAAF
jgi:hypothetical protein